MWFNEITGNLVSGTLMISSGMVCSIWGVIAMICVPKGKCRRFVLNTAKWMAILGILLLLTAVTALVSGQPWHVWHTFSLCGFTLPLVMLGQYFALKRIYAKAGATIFQNFHSLW